MEKIAINLVGGAAGDADYGLRLYNVGNGFLGVTGKIVSRVTDSMFLSCTAERRYTIAVEGDLVLSTETDDSFADKTEGVYGFDVDWSETARNFGNGTGKIIVTNPDSPSDVSVFEVFMGDTPSAVAHFDKRTGNNASVVIRDDVDVSVVDPAVKKVLSAPSDANPYSIGAEFVKSMLPVFGNSVERMFTAIVILEEKEMTKPNSGEIDIVIVDGNAANLSEIKSLIARDVPLIVVGDLNVPRGDAGFCAHNHAGDCALVDALMGSMTEHHAPSDHAGLLVELSVPLAGLERATLKDLMDSYGDDGDAKVEADVRDFGQLARTRQHEIDGIERAVAAANALGIDTSDIASKRDAALAKLVVFSDRFETGGKHEVTTDEAAVINNVYGELFGIHQDLDNCVSHWHHYKQQVEATHDRWSEGLASRKRSFRLADDAQDNRVATGYVDYAAKPEETQAASKAAIAELFLAIQRRDLRAAHEAANKGRQFGTREHLLASLIRRGVLVPVEETSTAA